jgi:hypothetical protein
VEFNSKNPTTNDEVSASRTPSEPSITYRLEALEAWQAAAIIVLDSLMSRAAALEKRVEQLEGHIHMVEVDELGLGSIETEPPYVEGEDNEGQEIWKKL